MPLSDDIRAVRDRALAELTAAHDYHADSEQAWRFLRLEIDVGGRNFSYPNPVTGTTTTEAELRERIDDYVKKRLRVSTFISFQVIFEAFFFDLVRAWLRAYPHAMSEKAQVPVNAILDAPDKAAIVDFLVEREVAALGYAKLADWFAALNGRLKLDCPTAEEVERLAEAKATRDVFVHNRGVANEVYVRKAGTRARHPAGEVIDLPDAYHNETWELLMKVVADVSAKMLAKFP